MKVANILLRLTKDHEVHKNGVTPPEVLLLAVEHHKGSGGKPVEVDAVSIKDHPEKVTIDQELDRLRKKYGADKVTAILTQVKEIPTEDFKVAVERGCSVALPAKGLNAK